MKENFKVWDCKIVIAGDSKIPSGFDSPPRMAAQEAIEDAGFEIISNFSGWGGILDGWQLEVANMDAASLKESKEEKMETIDIDISDETFLFLARTAHEQDITFNQLVINIITKKLKEDDGLDFNVDDLREL